MHWQSETNKQARHWTNFYSKKHEESSLGRSLRLFFFVVYPRVIGCVVTEKGIFSVSPAKVPLFEKGYKTEIYKPYQKVQKVKQNHRKSHEIRWFLWS